MINDYTIRKFHITALRSVKIDIVFNFYGVTTSDRSVTIIEQEAIKYCSSEKKDKV